MDMSKFEKIDGRDALRRLLDGEAVLDGSNDRHRLDGTTLVLVRKSGVYEIVNDGLRRILEMCWYVPKPFDVRQAMRDSPNEWVGKFKDGSEWWAVGFDQNHFNVIAKRINDHLPVDTTLTGITFPGPEYLDACIDINEVIKVVTR